MKKIVLLVLLLSLTPALTSCNKSPSAYEMLSDFALLYGIEGVIYSSTVPEGEAGFADENLFCGIFLYDGKMPQNYALYLNSHAEYGSECGVFVCADAAERIRISDACRERMRQLKGGDRSLLLISYNTVFYSTLTDKEEAERLWCKIIRSYT